MDPKQSRDALNRARSYFMRNDAERGLDSFITSLRKLGGAPASADIRSLCRECLSYLMMDPMMKVPGSPNIVYTPGQESALLTQLEKVRGIQQDSSAEDEEAALNRKIRLDQAVNSGKSFLAAKRISEADASFQEALKLYKDETRLFFVIAKALIDAGETVRALPYIKQGLQADPEDLLMKDLLQRTLKARTESHA